MCFNQTGDISTLNGGSLKSVDKFMFIGSSISSTEYNINIRLVKAWTAINWLLSIWKSDLSDTEYMCFNQKGDFSTLNGGSLESVNKFTYLRSSVSSTENDINM